MKSGLAFKVTPALKLTLGLLLLHQSCHDVSVEIPQIYILRAGLLQCLLHLGCGRPLL